MRVCRQRRALKAFKAPNGFNRMHKRFSSNLPFTILLEDFALSDVSSVPYKSQTQLVGRRSTVTLKVNVMG